MSTLTYTLRGKESHPVVLFLHGFMGSGADWDAVVDGLQAGYRCLTVDLPGHGGSRGLTDPQVYTVEGTVQALCDLLDTLEIPRCSVVGYSMGARVALFMALHAPERCSRVVLESASPGLEAVADREARRGMDEARAVRLEQGDFDAFLEDWYRQPLFASLARQEGLLERMIEGRRHNDPHELARVLRGMGTGNQASLWERLSDLKVSTLVIAGALDGKYVEVATHMAVLSDRIRAVVMPNAGHNIHAENPKQYIDVLRDFLKLLS